MKKTNNELSQGKNERLPIKNTKNELMMKKTGSFEWHKFSNENRKRVKLHVSSQKYRKVKTEKMKLIQNSLLKLKR